jgi:hypothetical protein
MANKLELAQAQFIGFHHGSRGFSVKELAQSMGLKKSEWLKIRGSSALSDRDKDEVDLIFKKDIK